MRKKHLMTLAIAIVSLAIGILFAVGFVLSQIRPEEYRIWGYRLIIDNYDYISFYGAQGDIGYISPKVSLPLLVAGFTVGSVAIKRFRRSAKSTPKRGFDIQGEPG